MVVLENRKEVVIGNHLIDDDDLSLGNRKFLKIDVERVGQQYVKTFEESQLLRRADLW